MSDFTYKIITDLLTFSPRQGKNVDRAIQYVTNLLTQHDIPYNTEKFDLCYPKTLKSSLLVDGKPIPHKASCWKSGKITNKDNILSSLTKSTKKYTNVNFNPYSKAISLATCSEEPSVTVARQDIPKLLRGKKVRGAVVVEKIHETCANILVGNRINPKNLIFSHLDSVEAGAIDNASGVAVSLNCIVNSPAVLKDSLFVISGNEELSYDAPVYWGHGYREFEKNHKALMENSKKIVILDCVGQTRTLEYTDPYWVEEAFPVVGLQKYLHKSVLLAGNIYELMKVYHSGLDTEKNIHRKHLIHATKKTLSIISQKNVYEN